VSAWEQAFFRPAETDKERTMRVLRWILLLSLTAFLSSVATCSFIIRHPALVALAAKSDPDAQIEESVQRKVAAHEAGHAVVCASLLGPKEVKSVTVYAVLGPSGRFGVMEDLDHNRLLTAEDVLKDAAVFMGGRASDKIVNGAPTNGAGSDLANVNERIVKMHAISGLGDSLVIQDPSDLTDETKAAVARDIDRANACAEAIVTANQDLIKDLADRIMKQPEVDAARTLSGDAFRAVLKEHPLKPVAVEKGKPDPCALGPLPAK
jgi:ATP-dependent Zn protease